MASSNSRQLDDAKKPDLAFIAAQKNNQDFLATTQKFMHGDPKEQQTAFIHLMAHHITRGHKWFLLQEKNEALHNDINDLKKVLNLPLNPNISSIKTILSAVGQALQRENEIKLTGDELFALGRFFFLQNHLLDVGRWARAKNRVKALEFFEYAVKKHSLAAKSEMALWEIRNKNYKKAVTLLNDPALEKSAIAKITLGNLFIEGTGVKQDDKAAVTYFEQATHFSDDSDTYIAQGLLGHACIHGKDINKDFQRGIILLTLAAQQDNVGAQLQLSAIYNEEQFKDHTEIKKDQSKSVFWLMQAANQHNDLAAKCLAACYYRGTGVPKNLLKAAIYFGFAADQNSQHKHEEQIIREEFCNHFSSLLGQFVTMIQAILEQYINAKSVEWKIDSQHKHFLEKTLLRALKTDEIQKELDNKVMQALREGSSQKADEKSSQLHTPSLSQQEDTIVLPENLSLIYEKYYLIYMASVIKNFPTISDQQPLSKILFWLRTWFFKYAWVEENQLPLIVEACNNFLSENANIRQKMAQSTALTPLTPRDTLIYNSLRIPTMIYETISQVMRCSPRSFSQITLFIIIPYFLSTELESDLKEGFTLTPEVADALSNVAVNEIEKSVTVSFKVKGINTSVLQARRNTFFELNAAHFAAARGKTEDKKYEELGHVDAKRGDFLQGGYAVFFSAPKLPEPYSGLPIPEFEMLKDKLAVVTQYACQKEP